jgi:hypothetical protein
LKHIGTPPAIDLPTILISVRNDVMRATASAVGALGDDARLEP